MKFAAALFLVLFGLVAVTSASESSHHRQIPLKSRLVREQSGLHHLVNTPHRQSEAAVLTGSFGYASVFVL
jgi:hypothetical protein